jgi:hypothetical protein F3_00797
MIQFLDNRLEKYKDLVVTKDNLKEMKATLREVISYRTKLAAFGRDKKRELKRPAEIFGAELEQVLSVINKYEMPLANQINVYEEQETEQRKNDVFALVKAKGEELGIREEWMTRYVPQAKWWNKTAKLSEVTLAVEHDLKEVLARQQEVDQAKALQKEKEAMLQDKCDLLNMSYGLSTPIEFSKVSSRLMGLDFSTASKELETIFADQLEIETNAKEDDEAELVEVATASEPKSITIVIKGEGVKKIDSVKSYLEINNIEYTIL